MQESLLTINDDLHCTPDVSLAVRVKQQKQILEDEDEGTEGVAFVDCVLDS